MKKLILMLGLVFMVSHIQAQEKKEQSITKKLVVEIKNSKVKPDVYIDSVKYDHRILSILDPEKIASVQVYKGKMAQQKFQAESVIFILTRQTTKIEFNSNKNSFKIKGFNANKQGNPVMFINGVKADINALKNMDPENIESINIVKDADSLKKYGTHSGIIRVKTKEKK